MCFSVVEICLFGILVRMNLLFVRLRCVRLVVLWVVVNVSS